MLPDAMKLSSNRYFFFFLAVFLAVFFAFFAFLAMLPSVIPKSWFNAGRVSTCTNSEYTTITKLILRASKRVNDRRTVTTWTKPSRVRRYRRRKGMEEVAYDLCIVDEASKATATEILIRLSRSKRSIIVGDPEQLPPFFEQFGEDILKEFEAEEVQATLLDRLLNEEAGLPAGCRAGLKKQYRMIEPIGDLVSTCFYRGKLKSPVKSHGVKLSAAFPKPVTWYSTQDLPGRFEEPEGLTFRNPTEVAQIRTILMRLQFVAKA
jgi:hypothetical protein